MRPQLTYATLFSAAGLGCYGFKEEQYRCVATAELIARRLEVQKANSVCERPEDYFLGDLSEQAFLNEIIEHVRSATKDLTFVIATPPCQGMSVANHKKKNELQRNSLVVNSLLFIEQVKPRFFVLENVRAFLKTLCTDVNGDNKTINDAIDQHLSGDYNIYRKVVNLKNYGSPSSRTRTLVIGVRHDLHGVTPLDIFPKEEEAPTLHELIGDLPALNTMGEIYEDDIYHSFKAYAPHMRPWISDLGEGQSAFDNTELVKRPHHWVNGQRVENKNGNGDKYRRNIWDRVAPCVHTRNDILSSQSTIHPVDDRVFSIRELCRLMGVPESFKWSQFELDELNSLPKPEKEGYLKDHEGNIRQCLGEGVPTPVMKSIARRARIIAENGFESEVSRTLRKYELTNSNRKKLCGHYTRQDIAYSLVSLLQIPKKKRISILEPSCGSGSFLPSIMSLFEGKDLDLTLIDIDKRAVDTACDLFEDEMISKSINSDTWIGDFLSYTPSVEYDFVIGNPPFGSSGAFDNPFYLKDWYAKFLRKALQISNTVAFIIPKSFISGAEFKSFRDHLSHEYKIEAIEDYGESAFLDVKIETIGLIVSRNVSENRNLLVRSRLFNSIRWTKQDYVCSSEYPNWLLYRNGFFDKVAAHIEFNCFDVFRDRKITKKLFRESDGLPVLKSRGLRAGTLDSSDVFVDSSVVPASFWNITSHGVCLVAPNLSYYPRVAILPQGYYVDGSVAVLIPKIEYPVERTIEFLNSRLFFYFYRIARNFSVRSLNLDKVSIFWWGIPFFEDQEFCSSNLPTPSSKTLFVLPDNF